MELIQNKLAFFLDYCRTNKSTVLLFLLLLIFIFLRFYELPQRAVVGWDQTDSAWAAKSILLDNPFRLEGVPIKGNTSMSLGPIYYYLITPFYFFTNLDMLASPIFASSISVISFLIFYQITRRLFDTNVALIASLLYTFSISVMGSDRVQAAFILIPILSYVVFYFLYKFLTGNEKYIIYFALAVGLGFHIHFTSVFYLMITLVTLPFFPRTKKMIVYTLLAIPVFLLFISPILYPMLFATKPGSSGITGYLMNSYHGLHVTRFLQLTHDGLISFEKIIQAKSLAQFGFIILPIFLFIFNARLFVKKKMYKDRLLFSYLLILWILIPWIVFATYNGELTDYYFNLPLNLVIAIFAFLLVHLYRLKSVFAKLAAIAILTMYIFGGLQWFFKVLPGNYLSITESAKLMAEKNKKLKFKDRDPAFYTYWVYRYNKGLEKN